jgi:hypothetical protein
MLFNKKTEATNQLRNELVSVSLKTLIDLAKQATRINLHHAQNRSQQSGGYVSRFKGRGMEFDETRLYQPGDDIRSIDWRVTARTGKTHTKVFREERERPVFISVDDRLTMQFATRGVFKSVLAAKLAGLLAWAAEYHGDRIGGQIFSELECRELKPQNGRHGEVVLIFIYDPLESSLPTKGRYCFTNNERDVVIDTSDEQRLKNFQQLFTLRLHRIESLAKKRGLTFIKCSTSEDPLQCLK